MINFTAMDNQVQRYCAAQKTIVPDHICILERLVGTLYRAIKRPHLAATSITRRPGEERGEKTVKSLEYNFIILLSSENF